MPVNFPRKRQLLEQLKKRAHKHKDNIAELQKCYDRANTLLTQAKTKYACKNQSESVTAFSESVVSFQQDLVARMADLKTMLPPNTTETVNWRESILQSFRVGEQLVKNTEHELEQAIPDAEAALATTLEQAEVMRLSSTPVVDEQDTHSSLGEEAETSAIGADNNTRSTSLEDQPYDEIQSSLRRFGINQGNTQRQKEALLRQVQPAKEDPPQASVVVKQTEPSVPQAVASSLHAEIDQVQGLLERIQKDIIQPAQAIQLQITAFNTAFNDKDYGFKAFRDIAKLETASRSHMASLQQALIDLGKLPTSDKHLIGLGSSQNDIAMAIAHIDLQLKELEQHIQILTASKQQLIEAAIANNTLIEQILHKKHTELDGAIADLKQRVTTNRVTAKDIDQLLADIHRIRTDYLWDKQRASLVKGWKKQLSWMPELSPLLRQIDEVVADYQRASQGADPQLQLLECQALLAGIKDATSSQKILEYSVSQWCKQLSQKLEAVARSVDRDNQSMDTSYQQILKQYRKLANEMPLRIDPQNNGKPFDKALLKASREVNFRQRVKAYIENNKGAYAFEYNKLIGQEKLAVLSIVFEGEKKATLKVAPQEIIGHTPEDFKHMFAIAAQHPKEYYYFDGTRKELEVMVKAFEQKYDELMKNPNYDAAQLETLLYKRFKLRETGQSEYVSLETLKPIDRVGIDNKPR